MKEKLKQIKPIQKMMVLALLMLLFIFTTQTSAIAQPLCDGKVPTIVGTEANDKLIGTDGPDVIHGLGGFDIIWGMGGDDVICGGDGTDNLSGRDGNDIIFGGNGHDAIWGGYGDDALRGGDANDTISGGPGNDILYGNHGNDSLYGRSGVDKLYGGWGTENNDSCYDDQGTFIWGCEQFNGEYIPPAPVPKTGMTSSYHPSDDGDLRKGVAWPDPRFSDNGDGTVTDHLTGLIWLKDAGCYAPTWALRSAMAAIDHLGDGQCGLTDGSVPGSWRLPNVNEMGSLGFGIVYPPVDTPFENTQPEYGGGGYWTSTYVITTVFLPHFWVITPRGFRQPQADGDNKWQPWPVRGGN